jgi:hypothetical protein
VIAPRGDRTALGAGVDEGFELTADGDRFPVFYLDESGNTGPDLLNQTQPLFTLASVCLGDAEAGELLEPVLDGEGEAKFSAIRRDPERRDALLQILRSDHLRPETARVSIFHKPYTTVAKLVDLLMEPGFHRRGMAGEWQTDGSTLRWPTTLYEVAGPELQDSWTDLLSAFVRAVRQPSPDHTSETASLLDRCRDETADERIEFALAVMREEAEEQLASLYDEDGQPFTQPVDPLDPAIAGLVEHLDHWGQSVGPFIARHDASSALERCLPELRRLSDPETEPYEVPGPGGTMKYPLQARRLELVDSRRFPQIQVADLLAGACSFQQGSFVRATRDREFAEAVAETPVRALFAQFVAPPAFVSRSMEGV